MIRPTKANISENSPKNSNVVAEPNDDEHLTETELDDLMNSTLKHGFCKTYDLIVIIVAFALILGIWVWGYHRPVPFFIKRIFGFDDTLYPEMIKKPSEK